MLRPYRGVSPRVHPTAFIDDSAQVIGDVEIGEESGVWMNAVIRGDVNSIRVGRRSNIQDGTIVHAQAATTGTHATIVADNVTIGHGALIHGCTIDDLCLIGMGAIVLNGAKIGANCLVGAGALVTEGKVYPDNSMILGAPAKAVRATDEQARTMIARAADVYVKRWKQYAAGLKRIG